MRLTILEDAEKEPGLFFWAGSIEQSVLELWLSERGWSIPDDLKFLWLQTGGGDFFETETIFGVFNGLWADDYVEDVNRYQRSEGMPAHFLAFHCGIQFSAVDLTRHKYVFLHKKTFAVLEEFSSLESWYVDGIRPLYQQTYSLPSAD